MNSVMWGSGEPEQESRLVAGSPAPELTSASMLWTLSAVSTPGQRITARGEWLEGRLLNYEVILSRRQYDGYYLYCSLSSRPASRGRTQPSVLPEPGPATATRELSLARAGHMTDWMLVGEVTPCERRNVSILSPSLSSVTLEHCLRGLLPLVL